MSMNRLTKNKQIQIISALVEGNSINGTVRMTGVHKTTILNLIRDLGLACWEYQNQVFKNLPCKRIQCDEIWNFCYSKEKNVPKGMKGQFGYGDVWTWVAICADTKLVPTWYIGRRDLVSAKTFINDLAGRLASRVQLTTDGHRPYLEAVEEAFGCEVDFSQLIKIYGTPQGEEIRYSPGECCGTRTEKIVGNPDPSHISTSFVERQNLTMRMCMRRFTRLTNGHSKKIENLMYSIAIHYMYYNFCRIHQSLRCTPAMKAKVTSRIWEIEDMINLLS